MMFILKSIEKMIQGLQKKNPEIINCNEKKLDSIHEVFTSRYASFESNILPGCEGRIPGGIPKPPDGGIGGGGMLEGAGGTGGGGIPPAPVGIPPGKQKEKKKVINFKTQAPIQFSNDWL